MPRKPFWLPLALALALPGAAWAQAFPGKVSFGTTGEGAFLHFATELLGIQAGFKYLHMPYKSASLITTEFFGDTICSDFGKWDRVARDIGFKPM